MTNTPLLNAQALAALLRAPEIAPHIAGLETLVLAVAQEASVRSETIHVAGTEVRVTGPVDAETAEDALHLTRVIARKEGRVRVDFTYPTAGLSGHAVVGASGRIEHIEVATT